MSGNNNLLQGFYSVNVSVQDLVFTSSALKRKLCIEQDSDPRKSAFLSLPGERKVAPFCAACATLNVANPLPCNQGPSRGLW
jgi:hypothetical protein